MFLRLRAQFDFFHLADLLGLLRILGLVVLEFAVVHQFAQGRIGVRVQFHQIKITVCGKIECLGSSQNSHLLTLFIDQANLSGSGSIDDPVFRLLADVSDSCSSGHALSGLTLPGFTANHAVLPKTCHWQAPMNTLSGPLLASRICEFSHQTTEKQRIPEDQLTDFPGSLTRENGFGPVSDPTQESSSSGLSGWMTA